MLDGARIHAAELLQPEDFAVFAGHDLVGGQKVRLWRPGPSVIAGYHMNIDSVRIRVREDGHLDIKSIDDSTLIVGLFISPQFWKRTAELKSKLN